MMFEVSHVGIHLHIKPYLFLPLVAKHKQVKGPNTLMLSI